MQSFGRGFETAELDYRGERRELARIQAGLNGTGQCGTPGGVIVALPLLETDSSELSPLTFVVAA